MIDIDARFGVRSTDTTSTCRSSAVAFGVSGWQYRDWNGPVYPSSAPKGFRGLALIGEFLDFIEVNATFYHPMGGDRSLRWLDETPPRFRFVVKAYRDWTHRECDVDGADLLRFREVIDPILDAERLDGVLVQLPPWVANDGPDLRRRLERLAARLAPSRLFVEFRHPRLYDHDLLKFMVDAGLEFVNVDLPSAPTLPSLSTINTGPVAYLRLHGRNQAGWTRRDATRDQRYDYHYSDDDLDQIVVALRTLASRAQRVLVAANNHFQGQAPAALVALKSAWLGESVQAPARLIQHFGLERFAQPLEENSRDSADQS